jgi:hypothetical protein
MLIFSNHATQLLSILLMEASLIVYDMSKLDHYTKVKINRNLFGYTNNSNNNQYHYKIKGILNEIPCFRLPKVAIIVKKGDQGKITNVLKKNKTKYDVFRISVNKSMLKKS